MDDEALVREVASRFTSFAGLLPIATEDGYKPFTYDRWRAEQRRFDRERTGRDLALKPRQIGFSTEELARDVWYAVRNPGVQVLIVSHEPKLCEQMFRAITRMVSALVKLGLIQPPLASSVREVLFHEDDGGSAIRIVEAGATERVADKRGRSGHVHRAHLSEVAQWGAAEVTMAAVLGATSAESEIVIESTANGAQGVFYELCRRAAEGGGEYKLHFFPWYEHADYRRAPAEDFDPSPRDADEQQLRALGCDDAQIAFWRSLIDDPARGGRERVRQEYPIDPVSCFRVPGGAYLDAATCDSLAASVRIPLRTVPIEVEEHEHQKRLGLLTVWSEPKPGMEYVLGADPAEGVGGDESAFDVMERRSGETVATFGSDQINPWDFGLAIAWTCRRYNGALAAVERNNHGHTTLSTLARAPSSVTPYRRVYVAKDGREGWLTNPATRPILFDDLHRALSDRVTSSPDAVFAKQCRTLVKDARGKPGAMSKGEKGGAHDDRWVARAIAWQMRSRRVEDPERGERERVRSEGDRASDFV